MTNWFHARYTRFDSSEQTDTIQTIEMTEEQVSTPEILDFDEEEQLNRSARVEPRSHQQYLRQIYQILMRRITQMRQQKMKLM